MKELRPFGKPRPKTFPGVRCIVCGKGIVAYVGAIRPEEWRAKCVNGHLTNEVDVDKGFVVSLPSLFSSELPE